MSDEALENRILNYLLVGPVQSYEIMAAMREYADFRKVDATLQRLRRAGRIKTLPRIPRERPFPLWQLP